MSDSFESKSQFVVVGLGERSSTRLDPKTDDILTRDYFTSAILNNRYEAFVSAWLPHVRTPSLKVAMLGIMVSAP